MSSQSIGQRFSVSRGGCWQCLPDCRSRLAQVLTFSQVAYNNGYTTVRPTNDNKRAMSNTIREALNLSRASWKSLCREDMVDVIDAALAELDQPQRYVMSRDYEALWSFIKAGGKAFGYVDYQWQASVGLNGEVVRDTVAIHMSGYYARIGVRGCEYGSHAETVELFKANCTRLNLEWIAIAPPSQREKELEEALRDVFPFVSGDGLSAANQDACIEAIKKAQALLTK